MCVHTAITEKIKPAAVIVAADKKQKTYTLYLTNPKG